jgi:hypothetical protein
MILLGMISMDPLYLKNSADHDSKAAEITRILVGAGHVSE